MKIDDILLKLINNIITIKEFSELLNCVDDINAKLNLDNYKNCTAVDVAVFTNKVVLLKALLAKGACPSGALNLTLQYAVMHKFNLIVSVLCEHMTEKLFFENISSKNGDFLKKKHHQLAFVEKKQLSFDSYHQGNKDVKVLSNLHVAIAFKNHDAIPIILNCLNKLKNNVRISKYLVVFCCFLMHGNFTQIIDKYISVFLERGFFKNHDERLEETSIILRLASESNNTKRLISILDFLEMNKVDINQQHELEDGHARLVEIIFLSSDVKRENDVEMLKLMLDRLTNSELIGKHGRSFFQNCVVNGREDLIKCMLDKRVITDIDHVSLEGHTALHIACLDQNKTIVELLVKHGANPLASVDGYNCISFALQNQDFEMLDLFKKDSQTLNEATVKIMLKDKYDKPLSVMVPCVYLVQIAEFRNERFIKELVARKFDMQPVVRGAKTAFHNIACDLYAVKLFIKFGFDLNFHYEGIRSIHSIIESNADPEVLKEAIKSGAIVDAIPGDNYSPLELAINNSRINLAESLIEYGANVNSKCLVLVGTVLFEAIRIYNLKLIKLITNDANFKPEKHLLFMFYKDYNKLIIVSPLFEAIVTTINKNKRMSVIEHLMGIYDPLSISNGPSIMLIVASLSKNLYWKMLDYLIKINGVEMTLIHIKSLKELLIKPEVEKKSDLYDSDDSDNSEDIYEPILYQINELIIKDIFKNGGLKEHIFSLFDLTMKKLNHESDLNKNEDSFTQSQHSVSTTSSSTFTFLTTELGWTPQLFRKERFLNRENASLNINEMTLQPTPTFSWFNGQLSSLSRLISVIENDGSAGVAYLYVDENEIYNQGCDKSSFKLFTSGPYRFNNYSVKPLKNIDCKLSFLINGESYTDICATHELKISGKERILLFPIRSDGRDATIYIGAIYLKNGLHVHKDIKQLNARSNIKPVEISIKDDNLRPQMEVFR